MRFWRSFNGAAMAAALLTMSLAAAPRWKDRYAEVNGVRLHYVQQGKGHVILFLHGFPEFWYSWKDLLADFGRDHHAVALDMRGYNLSAKPEPVEAYRVPLIVEDVRALAVKLKARKFVLVGHDWGGVIAWAFAAQHPEMLERLVIINAPHPTVFARELASNPAQQKASSYFNLFTSPQAEQFLSQNNYAGMLQAFGSALNEEDRKQYLAAWNQPGGLTGGLNYYRAAQLRSPVSGASGQGAQPPAVAPLAPITTPTLVIWGEKDTALLTGNLDGLDQQVKTLTIKRVPDGSHWVVHEKPGLVIQYMREFLKSPVGG
ncbi:MAG TPA: alpha/beta hydrolase [Bryobacteraceae bacterium]|nr:alpha/beta hydrolase [Bryobacteraceae bacterium]